jgi:hypothetical protein
LKKLSSSLLTNNRRGIACLALAISCILTTADAQFVSARKNIENATQAEEKEPPKPQEKTVQQEVPEETKNTPESEKSKPQEISPQNSPLIPKAKRRATMGTFDKTDSKSFFKQRNISNKLYFPIRSPYIPRVGGTDIRQEPFKVDFDRNNLIRETTASEELNAPNVVSKSPKDVLNSTPADSPAMSAGTDKNNKPNNVTYQFQDSQLVIDERNLQGLDPSKIPQNKIIIKHLKNKLSSDVKDPEPPEKQKTILSSDYKGNMELVDPNEVLMFFEKEQDDGDKATIGTKFVAPFEETPATIKSQGSSANYEVTE